MARASGKPVTIECFGKEAGESVVFTSDDFARADRVAAA